MAPLSTILGYYKKYEVTVITFQPVVSGASVSATSQGITAVPIVGTNVSIVPGNIGTQFIAAGGVKSGTQNIRPAGPASITMLQVIFFVSCSVIWIFFSDLAFYLL